MTADAQKLADELVTNCIVEFRDEGQYMAIPSETFFRVKAALASVRDAEPVDGMVLVPESALKWLFGEEGEFECPPEGYFRGKPAPYWWRSVFRKMIGDAHPTAHPSADEGCGWAVFGPAGNLLMHTCHQQEDQAWAQFFTCCTPKDRAHWQAKGYTCSEVKARLARSAT